MAKEKPDRKQKIVQAAIKCFIKSGVAQTRMNDIALEAGVDQPLIHYYFPNIDALYSDVINHVLEDLKAYSLRAVDKGESDPIKVLSSYILGPFEWGKKKPGYVSLWVYFYYLSSYQASFNQLDSTIREVGRSRISVMIYSGIEKGVFKKPTSMSVSELALAIQGIITGNGIIACTEKGTAWTVAGDNAVKASLALLQVKNS